MEANESNRRVKKLKYKKILITWGIDKYKVFID